MKNNIYKPIGLEPVIMSVENVCAHSELFYRCGLKPKNYLINLDSGNGQTTVTTYISESFKSHAIRNFGGRELFLEYKLDGSMDQLNQVIGDIHACAVYTNNYQGIIAIDVTNLSTHLNESQLSVFLKEIVDIGEYATLILYIPSVINRNIGILSDKIRSALGENIEVIAVNPYSEVDLVEIVKSFVDKAGIVLETDINIDFCILSAIRNLGIANIAGAKQIANSLIHNVYFVGNKPMLNFDCVATAFEKTNKRGEII